MYVPCQKSIHKYKYNKVIRQTVQLPGCVRVNLRFVYCVRFSLIGFDYFGNRTQLNALTKIYGFDSVRLSN